VAIPIWPENLSHIWAKSPRPGQPSGESLAQHTWEVLERLADLARLRPSLPQHAGQPRLWHLLAWAVFLHDWGKVAPGFQAMLRGGPPWPHRHEVLSLLWVDLVIGGLTEDEATWVAAVIASHHKDAEDLFLAYPPASPEDDPVRDLVVGLDDSTTDPLRSWYRDIAPGWIDALGLTKMGVNAPVGSLPGPEMVRSNGVNRIRHWLGRYRRLVRSLETGVASSALFLLRGHILQADHLASAGRQAIEPPEWSPVSILEACGVDAARLYDHQRQIANQAGSALLIAPTGSGKTEAALLWASAQARATPGVPRLFYTLPYQASMNAMYDRLDAIFPSRVGLVHGRSVLALYQRLLEEDISAGDATRRARAAQALVRLHAHPVRVFSPYQMLKVAYQLKGYEAMLADYALGAFIFDEIHAYEPARLAMILETIRDLRKRFGGRFLIMSATLPAPVRARVQEVLGGVGAVIPPDSLFEAFTRHRICVTSGDLISESGLSRIMSAFEDGQAVLVVCTTVGRAQQVYGLLRARVAEGDQDRLVLLHARFTGRDRLRQERTIMEVAGLHSAVRRPALLVATQVVEVSLNLDLDTIFSDPAPLEALVQRFGRVNRNRRMPLAPVHVFSEPQDGQRVYEPELVARAMDILREADRQPIDEARVQGWLDRIYSGDVLARWEGRYNQAAAEFRQVFLAPLRPFQSDPNAEERFERLFDGTEVLPMSLLGEYQNLWESDDPLAASQLLVPVSWRRHRDLVRAGRIQSLGRGRPSTVDAPYDDRSGLML
jgi:CRISPR-associated endonuclease/helicase Cas3